MAKIDDIMFNGAAIPFVPPSEATEKWLRVSKDGQTGVIDTQPSSNTPHRSIRFNHPNKSQTYSPRNFSYFLIDNFEDGNMDAYSYRYPSSTHGTDTIVNKGLTGDSTKSLELDGSILAASQPGDGLWYYPKLGDDFIIWFEPTATSNTPAFLRIDFCMQGYDAKNCYRLEWESNNTQGADYSLEKRKNGSNVKTKVSGDNVGPSVGATYYVDIQTSASSGYVAAAWYNFLGTQKSESLILYDSEYTSGGIGFETNGYMTCLFDAAHITTLRDIGNPVR